MRTRKWIYFNSVFRNFKPVLGLLALLLILLPVMVEAQNRQSAQVTITEQTVVNDDVTLKLIVRGANGLTAAGLTPANFTISEPSQNVQIESDAVLPIGLAVIVDLSQGSDVDLIQDTLRAYFNTIYREGDPVTFYILGPDQNTSTPQVLEPADLSQITSIIDGLVASARFYSVENALNQALAKLSSIQRVDLPVQALYVGSFLNDPTEAGTSSGFGIAGIPLHVVQAHRYRQPATPALQRLAAVGGGLFADNQDGASILKMGGVAPVNLVKIIYDAIGNSRLVYTLRYRSTNQSLDAQRKVTVTATLNASEQASAEFTYERAFLPPLVTIAGADFNPVRIPSRDGRDVIFTNDKQTIAVTVSFPDGIQREITALTLQVVQPETGSVLSSTTVSAPEVDLSGNRVIEWSLTSFDTPGATTNVKLVITATDSLNLSGSAEQTAQVTVRDLPPLPTPTAAPTLPPTAVPTPVSSGIFGGTGGVSQADSNLVIGLALVIVLLVVVVIILLISRGRLRRRQAAQNEQLQMLLNQPAPVAAPAPVEAAVSQNGKASRNGRHDDDDKPLYGRFIVLDGLEVQEIPIITEEFVIGRRADLGCHFVINEPFISPRHCMVLHRDGTFAIRDLNAKNGTFINGERIPLHKEVVVPIGSEVSITEKIKLELWDPKRIINLEARRQERTGQTTQGQTRVNSNLNELTFQPLPGIQYMDEDITEVGDDYAPF